MARKRKPTKAKKAKRQKHTRSRPNHKQSKRQIAAAKKAIAAAKKHKKYADAYKRRTKAAIKAGYASYYEQRLARAAKKGKSPHEARGKHPGEKPPARHRPGSLAAKYARRGAAKAVPVRRRDAQDRLYTTSQRMYSLSGLSPDEVLATYKRAIALMKRWRKIYPRVQWRLVVQCEAYEGDEHDTGVRSTPWITVVSAFDRAYTDMVEMSQLFVYARPAQPVLEPLILYIDHV